MIHNKKGDGSTFCDENSHEFMNYNCTHCVLSLNVSVKIDYACNNFIDVCKVCCNCIILHYFVG
jgi:hypothetical protein